VSNRSRKVNCKSFAKETRFLLDTIDVTRFTEAQVDILEYNGRKENISIMSYQYSNVEPSIISDTKADFSLLDVLQKHFREELVAVVSSEGEDE
jgi:hypothetical protein